MSSVKQPPDPDIPALEGEEQVDPHQAETPIEDTNPDHDDEHQPERDNIGNNAQLAQAVEDQFHALQDSQERIRNDILRGVYNTDTPENREQLREVYKQWMVHYEQFLNISEQFATQLHGGARDVYMSGVMVDRRHALSQFKDEIQRYYDKLYSTRSVHRTVSKRSSTSHRSSVTSQRLRDEQERAELEAKVRILKEQQQLKEEEFKLKLKREALELQTQLEVANARAKVYEQYSSANTQRGDDISTYSYDGDTPKPADVKPKTRIHTTKPKPSDIRTSTMGRDATQVHMCSDARVGAHSASASTSDVRVAETVAAMARLLKKPDIEVKKFNGDLTEFRRFQRHFKSKIEPICDDDEEKMTYLEQLTSGEPHDIVCGYSHLSPRVAFRAAMEELVKRYGNEEAIAQAYVHKALTWPVMKLDDVKSLDKYSILLSECLHAIDDLSEMSVFEKKETMQKIVLRLPWQFHEKWRSIAYSFSSNNKPLKFKRLVDFVREESGKGRDAMFGREALKSDTNSKKPNVKLKVKGAYGTTVSSEKKETNGNNGVKSEQKVRHCEFCHEVYHPLSKCNKFSAMKHDDKVKYVKTNGLCFGCLKRNHMRKDCTKKETCTICQAVHPTCLHINKRPPNQYANSQSQTDNNATNASVTNASFSVVGNACSPTGAGESLCTMAIVPVKVGIKGKATSIDTYAFLDPGSSASFITDNLLKQLGGQGKPVNIKVDTLGEPFTLTTQLVSGIRVSHLNGSDPIELPPTYTKDKMPVSSEHIPTQSDISQWPHLCDVELPKISATIGLLIGNDVPDVYTPMEIRTGPKGTPHATRTAIGWVPWNVMRNVDNTEVISSISVNRIEVTAIEDASQLKNLEHLVKTAIEYDFPERVIDDKKENSQEDNLFMSKVEKSITKEDGHYSINLPFKSEEVVMPNNRGYIEKRLHSLKKKMTSNDGFKEEYTAFMQSLFDNNYAEPVPEESLQRSDGHLWYLPHHGVYHPTKKKLRVVFDCAASFEGVSLNNNLLQGPNLTNSLLGVLLRFRKDNIAIMGDIKAMFHQVRVPQEDRDFLRFLWWPNGDTSKPVMEYRMCVHLFGAASSPACANYALHKAVEDSTGDKEDSTVDQEDSKFRNFYVDDCLRSLPTTAEAIQFVDTMTSACAKGGFQITKWISSSREVNESIPEDQRAANIQHLDDKDALPMERALGVVWDVDGDNFKFEISLPDKKPTRRNLLSITSSIFDPMGLVAPFILPAKALLQELCKQGCDWDDELQEEQSKAWTKWFTELPALRSVEIRRCLKPATASQCDVIESQLHHFADASEVGYGTASYLRQVFSDGSINVSLIMGKSRVKPLKKVTIPRMELAAAKLAVQMNKVIQEELGVCSNNTFYWTDSESVLRYIHNQHSRFHTYVANRLQVIHEGSTPEQWNYISTSRNPADHASRGLSPSNVEQTDIWFKGPSFLMEPQAAWPKTKWNNTISSDDPEVRQTCSATIVDVDFLSRFASLTKAKKVMAWLLRYTRNLKYWSTRRKVLDVVLKSTIPDEDTRERKVDAQLKSEQRDSKTDNIQQLCVDDLEEAEEQIIKMEQRKFFSEDINLLESQKQVKKTSPLKRLNPILVEGVLRVGGRISRASISHASKHPVIVPKNSRLAEMIIQETHRSLGHSGKNATLASLSQKYWIIKVSTLLKKFLGKCVICRKYNAQPMTQKMADLPASRLQFDQPPFTHTGCDFFGPFEVKQGRSVIKYYGVIFTCMTTRAVHLELADSLDTDSCINAIRRFLCRRGTIKYMYSDQGSNFKSANKELISELKRLNETKLEHYLIQKGISWNFNPASASHFGGVWERLIRSTKRVLNGLLHEQTIKMNKDGLLTLLCEVESILNSRPISKCSSDPNDQQVLTPNHILLFKDPETGPPGLFKKEDTYVRRRWRQVQYLSNLFWSRWVKEYMTSLQERQKWFKPQRNVCKGDLVLIVDNTPRNTWVFAKVLEVVKDKQGLVRSAQVKTQTGVLQRPIHKLCLVLESDLEM